MLQGITCRFGNRLVVLGLATRIAWPPEGVNEARKADWNWSMD
jgi:hypothetical protein